MNFRENYENWLNSEYFDEETKKNFKYQIDELSNYIEKGQSVDVYELENAIKTFS